MKRIARIVLPFLFAVGVAFPVLGQDTPTAEVPTVEPTATSVEETPEVTPVPPVEEPPTEEPGDSEQPGLEDEPPVTTPETFLEQILQLLLDASYIPWAAAGVVIFASLIKLLAFRAGVEIEGTAAAALALVLQVGIWLAYVLATHFNQADAFKTWYLGIVNVAQSLLPLFGALIVGHVGYKKVQEIGVPGLGFSVQKAKFAKARKEAVERQLAQ